MEIIMDSHYELNDPHASRPVGYRTYNDDRPDTPQRPPVNDYAEEPSLDEADGAPLAPSRFARIPRRLRVAGLIALLLILIPVGFEGWNYLQSYQSTDD